MLTEFKEFINRGNVLDLAVGVIIGGAFGTIVKSLTDDLIMPLVGRVFGNMDFSNLYVVLSGEVAPGTSLAAAREGGANVLAYGNFISTFINFLILAFVIFQIVKAANRLMPKKEAPAAPAGPTEVELLAEIRDALKK
ncbi:large conductance mechanosensitive channel protein MscL [Altererythrobacter buctensis]|uniref:Large-conductance mechanosensitive channel n=1 Tax=Alteraurantiacibacter buctensis TaxID=1503981 RepID=A0A844YZY8_9SPHN|nr:large conductance mechanosensitive channel protein MscL [Alteraurantiacibacter buctensis]